MSKFQTGFFLEIVQKSGENGATTNPPVQNLPQTDCADPNGPGTGSTVNIKSDAQNRFVLFHFQNNSGQLFFLKIEVVGKFKPGFQAQRRF